MGRYDQEVPEFCPLFCKQSTAMECCVSFQNYSSSLAKEQGLKLRGLHFSGDKLIMCMCQILRVP